MKQYTRKEVAKMFGVSEAAIQQQYAVNATTLAGMKARAINSNKKVNGYTAQQLTDLTAKYEALSK